MNSPRWRSLLVPLGVTTPNCPYCGHAFNTMPQRQRACPSCTQTFSSRKRTFDKVKALLTLDESTEDESQAALLNLTESPHLRDRLDESLARFHQQFGRAPTIDEFQAEHLGAAATLHAAAQRWGSYTSARTLTAATFSRRKLHNYALPIHLEAAYLALNVPRDHHTQNARFPRAPEPFAPSQDAFISSYTTAGIGAAATLLPCTPLELRKIFTNVATHVRQSLGPPLAVDEAWLWLSARL